MAACSNQHMNLDSFSPQNMSRSRDPPKIVDPFSPENRLRSCDFVKEFKRGCQKLMGLKVNVVKAGERDAWIKALTDFAVGDGWARLPLRQQGAYSPFDYSWLFFQIWLENRLGYNPNLHDIVSVQFGEARSFTIADATEWVWFLRQVARGLIRVTPHDFLHLLIRPREDVEEPPLIGYCEKFPIPMPGKMDPAEERKRCIENLKNSWLEGSDIPRSAGTSKGADTSRGANKSGDSDFYGDPSELNEYPDGDLPVEYIPEDASAPSDGTSALETAKLADDFTNTPMVETTGVASNSTGTPALETVEVADHSTGTLVLDASEPADNGLSDSEFAIKSPAVSSPSTPVPFEGYLSSSASTPMTPRGVNELQLVDIPEDEYKIEEVEDEDYGVVDDGSVDTSLGSFNAGDAPGHWDDCVDFCGLRQSGNLDPKGPKRVPVVKFPGMSVGLFDYQLSGVINLLDLTATVSGAILADEQGLGKSQEMFAVTALANGLRKNKLDVTDPAKARSHIKHHSEASAATAKTCPADRGYGFRCCCYHKATGELADRIPDGPTILVAPSRSCLQLFREAKTKLDQKTLKLRLHHETADKEDQLSPSDIKSLTASVTATSLADGSLNITRKAKPGQGEYVIVTSPRGLAMLASRTLAVKIKARDSVVSVPGLLPGLVFFDEFHEYIGHESAEGKLVMGLLRTMISSARGTKPLAFFVSGTPLGESPADIRPVIELFERQGWADDKSNPMAAVTTSFLDGVTTSYNELLATQADGLIPDPKEVADYRRRLNQIFKQIMVRRLGTDTFRGRPLTNIGPLRVNVVNHEIPDTLIPSVRAFADSVEAAVKTTANSDEDVSDVLRLLNGSNGPLLLEKLRLVSTFPNLASTLLDESSGFTFSASEIKMELLNAKHNVTKTRYFAHVPQWAMYSPKLATIDATVSEMLSDRTPIEGSPGHAKKLVIFCPVEAEALLVYAYLLIRKNTSRLKKNDTPLKPTFISSAMTPSQRQEVLDKFLEQGHAPPNVLVAPIALASTGLNLQRANYSIVTGPAWSKRENQQAYYRIHRVGQTQVTHLQLLTARWNPAERLILARHEGNTVELEDLWKVGNGFKGGSGGLESHQETELSGAESEGEDTG